MKRKVIRAIEIGGAVASLVAVAVSEGLRNFLTRDLDLPRWLFLATIAVFAVAAWLLGKRRPAPPMHSAAATHLFINQAPKLVTSDDKQSVDTIGTTVMKAPRGTFSTWVYLAKMGDGIRHLANNRYVFACTTGANALYHDVVALCNGPLEQYNPPQEPSWKVWLANQTDSKQWSYPDGREFKPGWHLLVLRWDHGVPRLDLLIDGRLVIVADGYERYWPTKYPDRLLIGCWPNYSDVHYANTYFWRTQLFSECAAEDWVAAELTQVPPFVAP